jgi:hypothetical protein
MCVQCGHSEKRVPVWIMGAPGILGTRGYYEVYKIKLPYFVLSLYLVSERNHVMMLGLHLWDFYC